MVRNYKKKTDGPKYSNERLREALESLRGGVSLKHCSRIYGIPRRTLGRHRKGAVTTPGTLKLGPISNALPELVEHELACHVKEMSVRFHGMTGIEVRKLAYRLAKEKNLPTVFSEEKKMAGEGWLQSFRKRHDLSLRKPQATNLSRIIGFNKSKVQTFFSLLKESYDKHVYPPANIYNMDETGFTTVQKPGNVIGEKGQKTVGKVTSGERGQLVTAVCSMNAVGSYIPPMFIFPRKRFIETLMNRAAPGCVGAISDSGWTNDQLFIDWLKHFIKYSQASKANRCLLIVDGHGSHKTLDAINMCRENGVDMISLPPHCTHMLQPLDRSYFKPLKAAYNKVCDNYMVTHPGSRITVHQVAGLASEAYLQVSSPQLAVNGFRCCGIWPFNSEIFPDSAFAPSLLTDEADSSSSPDPPAPNPVAASTSFHALILSKEVQPDPVRNVAAKRSTAEIIQNISPLPKSNSKRARTKPSIPAKLLTSTPEKDAFLTKQPSVKAKIMQSVKTKAARKMFEKPKGKCAKKTQESTADVECLVCHELYSSSRKGEVWVKCAGCNEWAHELCTKQSAVYICHECSPE